MPIVDGTAVDAANTNAQKLDKVSDDTAVGKITLANADAISGSTVTNLQREHNSAASFMGKALDSAKDDLPAWTANNGFISTNDLFDRTDAVSAKFHQTSGHLHTGAAGDGPLIDFAYLDGTQLSGYGVQGANVVGAAGTSDDVSSLLVGETPSTAQNVEGVVVNAPHNYIHIFDTSHDAIFDGSGNKVYGRLTEAAGVWTLSYYSNVAGTETAYSFGGAPDLVWYYQQLFTELDRPVYSDLFEVRSDEVAATAPTPGLDDVLAVDSSAGASDINMNDNALLKVEFLEGKHIATPAAPAAGYIRMYFKSDDKLYKLTSASVESEIGAASGLNQLTGDVTAGPGTGSQVATIANDAVTNAKLANMATMTVKSNITGGSADPVDNTLTAIIDAAISSTQGAILYRGAATWEALAPGTAGYQLTTNGAAANPTWTAAGGGGSVGNWTAYTPTFGAGWGTNTAISFFYQIVGDSMKVRGTFTSGTLVAGFLSISLPGGYTINSSKISVANTDTGEGEDVGRIGTSVANQHAPIVTATGSSTSIVYSGATFNVASHLVPSGLQFSSGAHTSATFEVPIN